MSAALHLNRAALVFVQRMGPSVVMSFTYYCLLFIYLIIF